MKRMLSMATAVLVVATTMTGCATRTSYTDLYGLPAPAAAAGRTIVISPNTKHVNIEGGEIIRFVAGDKEFTWNFFVAKTVNSFALNEIAPPGMLDHAVRVYLTPDPRYIGGNRDG